MTEPPPASTSTAVTVITGALQQYAWGRVNALSTWVPSAPTGPHAELWFGAHPSAPSPIVHGSTLTPGSTPLLVKLLAAASPLSIQVHPDADGIAYLAATSPDLLSDEGIKSEVLIAYEEFDVLAGFRDVQEAHALLGAGLGPEHPACQHLAEGNVLAAVSAVLGDGAPCDAEAMLGCLSGAEHRVMAKVVRYYSSDPGLAVAFLMNPRTLNPGDAMFVEAGTVHAYVDGFGVEVMTSSDNVLRLGLTPKRMAVAEALAITRPELQPVVIALDEQPAAVPGIPFSVQRLTGVKHENLVSGAIALCVTGELTFSSLEVGVTAGSAGVIHRDDISVRTAGECYIARPLSTT